MNVLSLFDVKYVGRVETVIKDSFTQNSVGKNINIDGKEFIVKSIFKRGNIPNNMIRLNVTNKWWEEHLKIKENERTNTTTDRQL